MEGLLFGALLLAGTLLAAAVLAAALAAAGWLIWTLLDRRIETTMSGATAMAATPRWSQAFWVATVTALATMWLVWIVAWVRGTQQGVPMPEWSVLAGLPFALLLAAAAVAAWFVRVLLHR